MLKQGQSALLEPTGFSLYLHNLVSTLSSGQSEVKIKATVTSVRNRSELTIFEIPDGIQGDHAFWVSTRPVVVPTNVNE